MMSLISILSIFIIIENSVYFNVKIISIDDCITEIYKTTDEGNKSIFTLQDTTNCHPNRIDYFSEISEKFDNYEFGEKVYFSISDKGGIDGYFDVNVTINEYTIIPNHRKFWKCIDCNTTNKDYINKNNMFLFYEGRGELNTNYEFFFLINSIFELNYNISY